MLVDRHHCDIHRLCVRTKRKHRRVDVEGQRWQWFFMIGVAHYAHSLLHDVVLVLILRHYTVGIVHPLNTVIGVGAQVHRTFVYGSDSKSMLLCTRCCTRCQSQHICSFCREYISIAWGGGVVVGLFNLRNRGIARLPIEAEISNISFVHIIMPATNNLVWAIDTLIGHHCCLRYGKGHLLLLRLGFAIITRIWENQCLWIETTTRSISTFFVPFLNIVSMTPPCLEMIVISLPVKENGHIIGCSIVEFAMQISTLRAIIRFALTIRSRSIR